MEYSEKHYLCFADFEFTCGYYIHKHDSEILSAGVVICDESYLVKEKFYCTARPNRFPKLSKQCRKLTKLSQQEINDSPDSNDVMAVVLRLVKMYHIDNIYVWGNFDKTGLCADMKQHQRCRKEYENIRAVSERIYDIQPKITRMLEFPEPVNIKELVSAFDFTPNGNFHHAMNDALALYVIYKSVYTENFRQNKKLSEIRRTRIEKIKQCRQEVERKRRETAFSVPLTTEEELYYSTVKGKSREEKNFIYLRSRFVSVIQNNPDEDDFLLLYLKSSERLKIIPKDKYNKTLQELSIKTVLFSRDDFPQLLLQECSKSNTVKI